MTSKDHYNLPVILKEAIVKLTGCDPNNTFFTHDLYKKYIIIEKTVDTIPFIDTSKVIFDKFLTDNLTPKYIKMKLQKHGIGEKDMKMIFEGFQNEIKYRNSNKPELEANYMPFVWVDQKYICGAMKTPDDKKKNEFIFSISTILPTNEDIMIQYNYLSFIITYLLGFTDFNIESNIFYDYIITEYHGAMIKFNLFISVTN